MRRFAVAPDRVDGDRVTFEPEEAHHLARVLRLRPGDDVLVVDGTGRTYTVRIDALGETARGTVVAVSTAPSQRTVDLTVVQGIPKGDKMDAVIRACTELGVRRVLPALTERTVVRLDASRVAERTRRWRRVAKEAAKQCGRALIPEIEAPRPLGEWLVDPAPGVTSLCFWEGTDAPLRPVLDSLRSRPSAVRFAVGPEGGLSRAEVEVARQSGWTIVGLGPRILRTETAAPAVTAILQFALGDLGG